MQMTLNGWGDSQELLLEGGFTRYWGGGAAADEFPRLRPFAGPTAAEQKGYG